MKKINKAKYAVLGMLAGEAQSGYEIKRSIQGSVAYFWQESDASIYPMLKTLEAEGKVTSRGETVGKRARTIFAITSAGKKELAAWLALPAEDEPNRNELLLKVFFGANIPKEKVIEQLILRQKKLTETERQFKHIQEVLVALPDEHPHKIFWLMTLNNGIIHAKAEARWITECFKLMGMKKKKD